MSTSDSHVQFNPTQLVEVNTLQQEFFDYLKKQHEDNITLGVIELQIDLFLLR